MKRWESFHTLRSSSSTSFQERSPLATPLVSPLPQTLHVFPDLPVQKWSDFKAVFMSPLVRPFRAWRGLRCSFRSRWMRRDTNNVSQLSSRNRRYKLQASTWILRFLFYFAFYVYDHRRWDFPCIKFIYLFDWYWIQLPDFQNDPFSFKGINKKIFSTIYIYRHKLEALTFSLFPFPFEILF